MTRITIQISGGVVTAVHSSEKDTEVEIIDYDNMEDSPASEDMEKEAFARIEVVTPFEVA